MYKQEKMLKNKVICSYTYNYLYHMLLIMFDYLNLSTAYEPFATIFYLACRQMYKHSEMYNYRNKYCFTINDKYCKMQTSVTSKLKTYRHILYLLRTGTW